MATFYLEVIGPDPRQPEPDQPRPFSLDQLSSPSLRGCSPAPDDITSVGADAHARGHDFGQLVAGSRQTLAGEELRWMMTIAEDSPAVEILPFLIDWGQSRHPAWFSWGFCGSLNPEIAGYPLS